MQILRNTMARPVVGVSFGPGQSLIAGGSGGYDFWDLTSASREFLPSHAVKYLYGCTLDPRGGCAYVTDYIGGFRILTPRADAALPAPGSSHDRHVTSFDLTRDGKRLIMSRGGAGANRVECWKVPRPGAFMPLWSLRNGKPVPMDDPHYHGSAKWFTNGVAISRNGKTLVTAETRSGASGNNPLVVLRDAGTGKSIAELGRSSTSFQARPDFAPDGHAVYLWEERLLERWDLKAGRCTQQLPAGARAYFRGLAVHPAGRTLIVVSGDGQVRYLNAVDLSVLRTIKCGIGKLHAVAVSLDGAKVAVGGEKGQLAVWDFVI
jgi:WD40 repeat protein